MKTRENQNKGWGVICPPRAIYGISPNKSVSVLGKQKEEVIYCFGPKIRNAPMFLDKSYATNAKVVCIFTLLFLADENEKKTI